MKWNQTILIPKSITQVDWVEPDLTKIINGYDPGGYSQTYISLTWEDKTDFDPTDAVQMISQTHRDFQNNLKIARDEHSTFHDIVFAAHRMDLTNNFLSNWLIGYSAYNMYIEPEFIPIWNGGILDEYIKNHDRNVWSVPLYIHV